MTRVTEIFMAASEIYKHENKKIFSRNDIRKHLGLDTHTWDMGYTSGFQGMVENCPPLRHLITPKFRAVFRRISKGKYEFTEYGKTLIETKLKNN